MNISQVIVKPVITEKSLGRVAANQYTFEVHKDASKHTVADAVSRLFNVTVFRVKIVVRKGKTKRLWRIRKNVQTSTKKIAIVTIDPSQTIDVFTEFQADSEE